MSVWKSLTYLRFVCPNSTHPSPLLHSSAVENLEDTVGLSINFIPREGISMHLHDQLIGATIGEFNMAMNYLLFEDYAQLPVATKDPLYATFAEFKAQF